jgi:hypothetical protein
MQPATLYITQRRERDLTGTKDRGGGGNEGATRMHAKGRQRRDG